MEEAFITEMWESIARGKDKSQKVPREHDPELSPVGRGGGEEVEGRGSRNQAQQLGGQRYKKGQVVKMSGLYGEEQPSPRAEEFRVGVGMPVIPCNRRFWENLGTGLLWYAK